MAGCFYTGVGLLRMGWVTNFLSHAQVGSLLCEAGAGQRQAMQSSAGQVPWSPRRVIKLTRTPACATTNQPTDRQVSGFMTGAAILIALSQARAAQYRCPAPCPLLLPGGAGERGSALLSQSTPTCRRRLFGFRVLPTERCQPTDEHASSPQGQAKHIVGPKIARP